MNAVKYVEVNTLFLAEGANRLTGKDCDCSRFRPCFFKAFLNSVTCLSPLCHLSNLAVNCLTCLTCVSPVQVVSCDQNLNRCCELVELTAKIQSQLFNILNLTAREGSVDL